MNGAFMTVPTTQGQHTIREILSQPATWRSALDGVNAQQSDLAALLAKYRDRPLITLGSGSPFYLAAAIAALVRDHVGRGCAVSPSAELIFNRRTVIAEDGPILGIIFSRSGETSEAIAATRIIQRGGGAVIAVGCDASTSLMRLADVGVEVAEGREESAAQTRSFAGMYIAGQAIVALMGRQLGYGDDFSAALGRLPGLAPSLIDRAQATISQHATDLHLERIFVLGSGVRYGIACETALKFQEMSLTNIHAYNPLEFRHGPMSMADEQTLVIGLIGGNGADEELAVLHEAQAFGSRVVALAEQRSPLMEALDGVLTFDSGLPENARTALYLPPLQLMAYERAMAKGLNPDAPRNVTKFVRVAHLESAGQ
jgi:glucosamine--fructose-6-phosphate aminotransferase (isomerizing)